MKEFGASAGVQWMAERYSGTTKIPNVPNYFRTDAGLSYQRGKYNVSLLVNNVGDDRNLLTSASVTAASASTAAMYTYIVEARRNFRMSIAYRF